jgi:hypothetical protein
MRRLLAVLGGVALLRAWLSRRRPGPPPEVSDPRADELRRKLEESRTLVEEDEFASGETPVDVDERRRDVHERGRGAIEEMERREEE